MMKNKAVNVFDFFNFSSRHDTGALVGDLRKWES